ncbi:MAG: type II toxin-antitoxin system RelE/ParE family toxin, partial [Nitrospiraceae bacterium]
MSADSRRFSIEVSPHAERDLAKLPDTIARLILEEILARLSTEPIQEMKTRIKRLTGFSPPLYRLRVGDYRVCYPVLLQHVVILGIFHKKDSDR